MITFLKLLAHVRGWSEWLEVDGVKMQVRSLGLPSTMHRFGEMDDEGVRVANQSELRSFANKYQTSKFLIHAVDPGEPVEGLELLGPAHKFFTATGGTVQQAGSNATHGFPSSAAFLWVKEE